MTLLSCKWKQALPLLCVYSVLGGSLPRRIVPAWDLKKNKEKERNVFESDNERRNCQVTSSERNGREIPETKKIYWLLIQ